MGGASVTFPCYCVLVIRLVSGLNSDVEGTLGGLRRAFVTSPGENGLRTGLRLHPLSKTLVLNSTPGLVQFFDTETQSLSSEVMVVPVLLQPLLTACTGLAGCGWAELRVAY